MRFSLQTTTLSTVLGEPVSNRNSRWNEREALILCVRAEHQWGIGVAAPLPHFSPDDFQDVRHFFRGLTVLELPELDRTAHPLEQLQALNPALPTNAPPSAMFALESALLDWILRATSFRHFTREFSDISISHLSNSPEPEGWSVLAAELLAGTDRVDCVKCKVGRFGTNVERELHATRELRSVLGPSIEIRLDANGCFSLENASSIIDAFATHGASSIEEPVNARDLLQLPKTSIPWLADESLTDPLLAQQTIESPGCGGLSIKPAVVGGLCKTLALIERAQHRGLGVAISHIFDGPIACAALRHLAMLTDGFWLPSALGRSSTWAGWPQVEKGQNAHSPSYFADLSGFVFDPTVFGL